MTQPTLRPSGALAQTAHFALSSEQAALAELPVDSKVFLEGPAGAGKTTAGVARLLHLLATGVPAESILILVPQRTLATPYSDALRCPELAAGGQLAILTVGGLAQRMVDLFWPLIAEKAGFGQPRQPPTFLTLETAQYFMARLVNPLLDQGYFEDVVVDRHRLYSQILDNLNKAAVVGFPHTEIGERLKAAWGGESGRRRMYDEVQECANRFREHCLAHNLLDFSLQIEVFVQHLWPLPLCRDYLLYRFTHLIVDNVEEDTPVAHDLLKAWLPQCRSALVIYDREAGYRRFLGADPQSAYALRDLCPQHVTFTGSFVTSADMRALAYQLARSLNRSTEAAAGDARAALAYTAHPYYPQMLDWVAAEIARLVHEQGVSPGEIVVLAPFLSDTLRFSLTDRLKRRGIPVRSHRPSRALRDEPAARCLLTLAAIAHPQWGFCPTEHDVAHALMQAIEGMDLVRAQLLAKIVYRSRDGTPRLSSFAQINPDMRGRITPELGERYEGLYVWIADYIAGLPLELDHFLSRLFGEVLSQPGYGFHRDLDAGEAAANLIESVRKFRWATANFTESEQTGREYVQMVQSGVLAAQYVRAWQAQPQDVVLLSPAYTFLMSNRPVDYQFWLDVGSGAWWERLYQPLTHPYVLSRHWPADRVWTDADEFEARQDALFCLVLGLIRRCRRKVYLGLSRLDEQGFESKGPLLQAVDRMLRRLPAEPNRARAGVEVADV